VGRQLGVVGSAATGVTEHPVGLVDGCHRAGIVGVTIGMVHAGEAPVGAPDLLRRRRRGDPENLVVGDDSNATSERTRCR
jgi:hypothetical protein